MNSPITITEVIGRSEQGMTRPFLCEGDDWMTYYVKGSYAGKNSLCCEWGENIEHRTPNIEHRSEEKRSLAEAVWIPGSRQISRQSVARVVVEDRDMNHVMVSRFGGDSGRKWGIPTEIPTKWRDFALVERGEAESRQLSRHHVQFGRKKDHGMGRPFRARNPVGDGTQGVAVGCRMVPRWGVYNSQGFLVSQNQIKRKLNP